MKNSKTIINKNIMMYFKKKINYKISYQKIKYYKKIKITINKMNIIYFLNNNYNNLKIKI